MKIDQSVETPDPPETGNGLRKGATPRYRRPTKEDVRLWLARVIASGRPPPSIFEIKNDLWRTPSGDDEGVEHDCP